MKYPVVEIGKLCRQTEQRDPRNVPDLPFAYVDISSVDKDLKVIVQTQEIIGKDAPSRARKVNRTEDVLVSTVRPNLNAVAIVLPELDGQIASTGFCVLRPRPALINSRYLFYRTLTQDFVSYLTARMRGANYPAVTDEVVRRATIPLPPLSEQRRIVEILDQANALRRKRAAADAKASRVLQTVFCKMFGDPIVNSQRWKLVKLEDLCIKVTDGTHDTPKPVEEGYYLITNKHFIRGYIDFSEAYKISPRDHATVIARSKPEYGDVLYSQIGTLGIACLVETDIEFSIKNCALFKPNPQKLSGKWLVTLLNIPSFKNNVLSNASGGLQKYLSLKTLRDLQIPTPPLSLQKEFEKYYESLSILIMKCQQNTEKVEGLFSSLLHRASSGDLTARWREGHMKELIAEMKEQAIYHAAEGTRSQLENVTLQESLS